MTTFTLDTSGLVWIKRDGVASTRPAPIETPIHWSDLSPFEQGYIEAGFAGLAQFRSCDSEDAEKPLVLVRRTGRYYYDGEWFGAEAAYKDVDGGNIPLREIEAVGRPTPDRVAFSGLSDDGPLAFEDELTDVGFSDLAPATLEAMLKDCERAYGLSDFGGSTALERGRGFWVHRQTGTDPDFPPLTLYFADGLIYQREVGQ